MARGTATISRPSSPSAWKIQYLRKCKITVVKIMRLLMEMEMGCVEKWTGGQSGLKSARWEGNDSIIVEKNTSLSSKCHRVVSIEEGSGKNELAQGMHGPCKTKGSSTHSRFTLSLSKELDDSNKALDLEDELEIPMEVATVGRVNLGLENLMEDPVEKDSIHQDKAIEQGGERLL
ncbi:hypothetical protein GOBAR_DD14381 [Gossypium barbadense]|nr:hypothetical protein GOBAR_DD14381 [Gossypium barbadense]